MNAKFDDFIQERVTNKDFCTRVSTFETINYLKEFCLILQQTQKRSIVSTSKTQDRKQIQMVTNNIQEMQLQHPFFARHNTDNCNRKLNKDCQRNSTRMVNQ